MTVVLGGALPCAAFALLAAGLVRRTPEYLFRPYAGYRIRAPRQLGPRPERRGWERLGG
ncbi:hypothetical protein [Streptomyces naphthomycinicus]|uniref:hypothetical protein n=1 Tax=Streptomyces naphthomycinicus TaxID=2872625 RepID=UPI001CED0E1C|nr:hypothetical protein [Streptomyces sp. TML10]